MIRFKCIYCGQRILAPDNGAGKKGKCPKCAHLLTVPESTKGRPAISPVKEPTPDRPKPQRASECEKVSERREQMSDEQAEALADLCKESFGFLIPTYDMLSLLLMALTFILLFITNIEMRMFKPGEYEFSQTQSLIYGAKLYLLIAIVPLFLVFRIFGQSDIDLKKQLMVFFAVMMNVYCGVIAGIYVLGTASACWLVIFPIWNIINCIIMLGLFYNRIIDEDCLIDRKTTLFKFIFGLIATSAIFYFCNYVLKLYWAVTFSICIIYVTSFDKALQSVFPRLAAQDQQ